MATTLGSAATRAPIFDDLHFANDTEAPTSSAIRALHDRTSGR
jgi:hypothetical protein